MRVPHKMQTYWDLLDAGIIPSSWTPSVFKTRSKAPDFPHGITEGRKVFYDADEVAAYVEAYWAKLRAQQAGDRHA